MEASEDLREGDTAADDAGDEGADSGDAPPLGEVGVTAPLLLPPVCRCAGGLNGEVGNEGGLSRCGEVAGRTPEEKGEAGCPFPVPPTVVPPSPSLLMVILGTFCPSVPSITDARSFDLGLLRVGVVACI